MQGELPQILLPIPHPKSTHRVPYPCRVLCDRACPELVEGVGVLTFPCRLPHHSRVLCGYGGDFHLKIRPALRPISHRPPLYFRQQPPQQRIVIAGNDHSIEGHTIHELEKSFLHITHVPVTVHVLAIDVGHHRQDRRQFEERP